MSRRAKGQILLEMFVVFNPVGAASTLLLSNPVLLQIRASIRTFNPREHKYLAQEPKFKRQVILRNVNRLKVIGMAALEVGNFLKSLWSWESPVRTIVAFIVSGVAEGG